MTVVLLCLHIVNIVGTFYVHVKGFKLILEINRKKIHGDFIFLSTYIFAEI